MHIFIQKRKQSPDTVSVLKTYFQSNVAHIIGTVIYTTDHTHIFLSLRMYMHFLMKMNSKGIYWRSSRKTCFHRRASLNDGLQHMLGGNERYSTTHVSTAPAAKQISACVRGCSGFQLLNWGHGFENKSILSGEAEVIDVSAYAFTERMNSIRNSPASSTAPVFQYRVNDTAMMNHSKLERESPPVLHTLSRISASFWPLHRLFDL